MFSPAPDTASPADANRRMFDRIASHYDRLNHLMSLGLHRVWRRQAVQHLLARGGREFLDIGCGTGDVALMILQTGSTARVTGIDPATGMLALAMAKTRKAGLMERAVYQEGDALALPYPAGAFDGIACAFVLRNLTDRARAFAEMRRVLRPGGTLAILELTRPRCAVLNLIHKTYTCGLIPLLGRLLSRERAYQYLADTIDQFPLPEVIVAELERAGFPGAASRALTGGFVTLFKA